ncbi:MAG: right-handed parallel beta-helix repeat-containing protein, partial [Bacteroides sp.]|nr:right-handed parallel beta-helix repeat-containing protein [Bacteroides sp.]
MKNIFRIFIIAIMGLNYSCQQSSVDIYLAPDGDDTAIGTKENPVKSIEKARELAGVSIGQKEVHVIFLDGIYYLPEAVVFNSEHSGSAKNPVVFRAANTGQAVISGGARIQLKWEAYKDGIYKAQLADDVAIDQLYVNGQRQRMARYPNAVEGKNVFDSWDLSHSRSPDPANDPLNTERINSWSNPTGAYLHAMHRSLWGDMHWLVKGKNDDGTLDLEGGWQNNRPSPMHPRYRMVENIFEELDSPGEWYYNSNEKILYYYPRSELVLSTAIVEIVRLTNLIEFKGNKEDPVHDIQLEGFVFKHASRSFMENKEQLLRSDWTTYRGGAIFYNGAEDCSISNCEFDQLGGNSVFVSNYNRGIHIRSCYIHHSGANGIAFVGDPLTVRSPLFRYGKQDYVNMDRTPGPKGDNYPQDCSVE